MSAFSRRFLTALALTPGLFDFSAAAAAEPSSSAKLRLDHYGDSLPPRVLARLGTVRLRGVQRCLAFSPDGKLLAGVTGNGGACVTFWDAATGREIRRINGSAGWDKLAFSPDGKRLACSAARCQVFEPSSGKELYSVEGISGDFSGDGKMLVTGSTSDNGRQVDIWDAATGRQLHRWSAEKGVIGVLSSVGWRTLAILNWNNRREVAIHDIATGKKIRSLHRAARGKPNPAFADAWRDVTLSRDDKSLVAVSATDGGIDRIAVELLDVESGKIVFAWRGRGASRCVFSPDGKRLAWMGDAGSGKGGALWMAERDSGTVRMVRDPSYMRQPLCFSPDGKLVAGITMTFAVTLRDVGSGKEMSFLDECDREVRFLTLTPDGRHVLTQSADGNIFVRDAHSGRLLRRVPVPLVGREFIEHVLPEGRLLTVDPDQFLVGLRNILTGEIDQCFAALRPDFGPPVSVPAPGNRYAAIYRRDGAVAVFDLQTGKRKYRLDADQARQGLKISADGNVLAWCNRANGKAWHSQQDDQAKVHVYHHASEKAFVLPNLQNADPRLWVDTFKFHRCLSPDGRWLVLPTRKGPMRRWDLTTGLESPPLSEPLHGGSQMHWSPGRRILAMRGSPSPIEQQGFGVAWEWGFWDVAKGVRLRHLKSPDASSPVGFSADGRTLFSGDSHGIIHLWETATGAERDQLRGHLPFGIHSLSVSADGRILASGGGDSQVLVWDLTGRMADGQWRLTRHSPEQRRACWEALASADAKAACLAMWQLAADPQGTIAFLREQLRPIPKPYPRQIARAIAALDSAAFAERERSMEGLEKLNETASAELRRTLSQKPSLEVRRRIEALLEKLEGVPRGRQLQALRSVEVLEHIDTPKARNILRKLAEGAAAARLTQEAQRALERSAQTSGVIP